jgi:hypothetical protein
MTTKLLVACVDIGSVANGRFGWWTSDHQSGHEPSVIAKVVASALEGNRPVALGFECPLFVPLPDDEVKLGCARPGEGNRAWSAGAGPQALTTGLVQVSWLLRAIKSSLSSPREAHLSWEEFKAEEKGLFLWEAFVSGKAKSSSHVGDAKAAGEAFLRSLPNPDSANAIVCATPVMSLVGAALLRTGWSNSPLILASPTLVIAST